MNVKGYLSMAREAETPRVSATRVKTDDSPSGTEFSGSEQGIEVEAIEFDKPSLQYEKVGKRSPRKLILFIFAFVVILIASAVAGFGVIRSKKKSAATSTELRDSVNGTNSEGNAGDSIQITIPEEEEVKDTTLNIDASSPTESSVSTLAPTAAPSDEGTSFGSSWGSFTGTAGGEALWSDNVSTESESSQGESLPSENSSSDSESSVMESSTSENVSPESDSSGVLPGSDNISSSTVSSEGAPAWSDPICPNHNLGVVSTCAIGAASTISTASFCFASKRDGDWYWIRSSEGSTANYDSWDYTEATEGDLTIMDLAGGNYIISLVRDSMQPYDEIISYEFTVPECS